MSNFREVENIFDYVQDLLDKGYKPEYVFDVVGPDREGINAVELNGKHNFINGKGNLLSDTWFDDVWYFKDGLAMVKLDRKYNIIDTDGKLISEEWFEDIGDFREGLAKVELNGKCNFINTDGEYLSEQWFDKVWGFTKRGYAFVMLDGEGFFIDNKGEKYSIVK